MESWVYSLGFDYPASTLSPLRTVVGFFMELPTRSPNELLVKVSFVPLTLSKLG